jgi:hypothetical protein
MKMFAIDYAAGEDAAGPYTDEVLLQKTLDIIQQIDPNAEIISRECNPWSEQISAGLKPYEIHADLVDGEVQLPLDIHITWPPKEFEGLMLGTEEFQKFVVWAKDINAARLRLVAINKATRESSPKAAAAGVL